MEIKPLRWMWRYLGWLVGGHFLIEALLDPRNVLEPPLPWDLRVSLQIELQRGLIIWPIIFPWAMSIPVSKLELIVEVQLWHQAESSPLYCVICYPPCPYVHTVSLMKEFGEMAGRREAWLWDLGWREGGSKLAAEQNCPVGSAAVSTRLGVHLN